MNEKETDKEQFMHGLYDEFSDYVFVSRNIVAPSGTRELSPNSVQERRQRLEKAHRQKTNEFGALPITSDTFRLRRIRDSIDSELRKLENWMGSLDTSKVCVKVGEPHKEEAGDRFGPRKIEEQAILGDGTSRDAIVKTEAASTEGSIEPTKELPRDQSCVPSSFEDKIRRSCSGMAGCSNSEHHKSSSNNAAGHSPDLLSMKVERGRDAGMILPSAMTSSRNSAKPPMNPSRLSYPPGMYMGPTGRTRRSAGQASKSDFSHMQTPGRK